MTTPKRNRHDLATRVIHAGQEPDPLTGAATMPVYTSSIYVQDGIGRNKGYSYSRGGNPTKSALEACLADLENAAAAFTFPSGVSAAATILEYLPTGSKILAHQDIYGGVYELLVNVRTLSAGHSRGNLPWFANASRA